MQTHTTKYTHIWAYPLQFNISKIINSDFWGWGLSVWPLRPLRQVRHPGLAQNNLDYLIHTLNYLKLA